MCYQCSTQNKKEKCIHLSVENPIKQDSRHTAVLKMQTCCTVDDMLILVMIISQQGKLALNLVTNPHSRIDS